MIDAFKPHVAPTPVRPQAIDGPTLDLLSQETGVVLIYPRTAHLAVALSVMIREDELNALITEHGEEHGKTLLKDNLLRSLDFRLVKVLGL